MADGGTKGTARQPQAAAGLGSEGWYRELVELAVDGILIGEHDGTVIEANPCMCEMMGLKREQLVGLHIVDLPFTRESLEQHPFRFDLVNAGQTVVTERAVVRSDGSEIVVEMRTRMMPDGRYQSIMRDITARKRADEAVKESQRALYTLLGNLPGMAYRCRNDPDWTMEFFSAGVKELTGYPASDLLDNAKRSYADIIHPDDRQAVWNAVQEAVAARRHFQLIYRIQTANGAEKWVWEKGVGVYSFAGELLCLEGFITDITERKAVEDELRRLTGTLEQRVAERTQALEKANTALDRSVVQLRKLAADLAQAETRERKRLAGTLHDQLQPFLVAATIKASLLDPRSPEKIFAKSVQELLGLIEEALQASRALTVDLYPPVLLDAGLVPGLHWLADWFRAKHDLFVRLSVEPEVDLPESLGILLFRAVRELLLNVVKHAHTAEAFVTLTRPQPGVVAVSVVDKGCGFAAKDADVLRADYGFGLFYLREQLAHFGGRLDLASAPGQGTSVSLTVSLPT